MQTWRREKTIRREGGGSSHHAIKEEHGGEERGQWPWVESEESTALRGAQLELEAAKMTHSEQ